MKVTTKRSKIGCARRDAPDDMSNSLSKDFKHYYMHIMPIDVLENFLCGGSSNNFKSREMTLFGPNRRVLERHGHFSSVRDAHLCRYMTQSSVTRMDFGPVCEPIGPTLSEWKPYENHLAFDLDLEDYKGVFPESVDGYLTAPLWCHLVHSLRALYTLVDLIVMETDNVKRDHVNAFGVFSGRRGVHLIFPTLHRSWATTDQTQSILRAAAKLSESKSAAELVSLALDRGGVVANFVREIGEYAEGNLTTRTVQHMRRQKHLSSFDANDVERLIRERDSSMDERGPDVKRIDWCVVGVMMVAPKADYTVTADYTHLLKCPFSVHDKTGLVSLPFDITHDLATNLEAHLSGASIKGIAFNAKAREVLTKRVKNAASFLTDLMAKLYSSNSKE